MIRALLAVNGQVVAQGGHELINQWRQQPGSQLWLDLCGNDQNFERQLLAEMGINNAAIDDLHRFRHPPKFEQMAQGQFWLYRAIVQFDPELDMTLMPMGLFVFDHCFISCHPQPSRSIDQLWQQCQQQMPEAALMPVLLMQMAAQRYLQGIQDFELNMNEMEDRLQAGAIEDDLKTLLLYKTRLRKLKRIFLYHERLAQEAKKQSLTHPNNHPLNIELLDLYEQNERLHSLTQMYYELCGDLINGYLSLSSHQLNITMRLLTVITAIFVPLTFIAGIYGMNFEYMPELTWPWAYFVVMAFMAAIAAGMMWLFKRKQWL